MALEDITLIVLLVIFEAILWIIPKTRKKNGNIIIAFKTFPLGMIAFLLSRHLIQKTVRLISDLRMENISISPNWQFSIALFLTIAVIIVSGILSNVTGAMIKSMILCRHSDVLRFCLFRRRRSACFLP
ncbi:MAG: hypothetical protein IKA22_04570 [Lentisphaeria bacterium]|nr:hypothetical protein [Lentisphaeria bacterium]